MAEASYINVDLEVRSNQDLKSLVDALGECVSLLHVGKMDGFYFASFESLESGCLESTNLGFMLIKAFNICVI